MVCKSCGAFLSDDLTECPVCGSSINQEDVSLSSDNDTVVAEPTAETIVPSTEPVECDSPATDEEIEEILEKELEDEEYYYDFEDDDSSDKAEEKVDTKTSSTRKDGIYLDQMVDTNEVKAKKLSTSSIIAIILAVLLVISAVFCVVLIAGKDEDSPLNSIYDKVTGFFSTVFSDNKVKEYGGEEIIAVFGDHTLTNAELSIYYYDLIYYYYSYYGNYLFDPSTSLFDQEFSDTQSWGDYFVEEAIESWKFAVALCDIAKENNFVLPDDISEMLTTIDTTLEESAVAQGFASADEYLQQQFGPFVTMKHYEKYFSDYCNSEYYYSVKYEEKYREYLDDDIDTLETYNVSVRHILISPEVADDEASLAEAKAKAESIVQEWTEMGATEDNFATLAEKYTDDTASASVGGLYEDFYAGKMTEAFDAWCFDTSRVYGDYDIVETEYGYHIMFFVTRTNPDASTKTQEELTTWIEKYMASIPVKKHLDKVNIKIADVYKQQ